MGTKALGVMILQEKKGQAWQNGTEHQSQCEVGTEKEQNTLSPSEGKDTGRHLSVYSNSWQERLLRLPQCVLAFRANGTKG